MTTIYYIHGMESYVAGRGSFPAMNGTGWFTWRGPGQVLNLAYNVRWVESDLDHSHWYQSDPSVGEKSRYYTAAPILTEDDARRGIDWAMEEIRLSGLNSSSGIPRWGR